MCPALEAAFNLAMSKRGSASRKYRVVSKGPVLFARLYDVHRRSVQIRDWFRLCGVKEDALGFILETYVSFCLQDLPARRIAWWKDDSFPPIKIVMAVVEWREVASADKEWLEEMAASSPVAIRPLAGYGVEVVTNDMT